MDVLILAGGDNKRMPVIKGFLEIKGRRTIDSTVELLKEIFDRVIISTNTPELYSYLGVPIVGDVVRYKGPMTGILSALITLKVPEIFVTACDMPFIKPALVRYIVDKYKTHTTAPPTQPSPSRGEGERGGESPGSTQWWGAIIPVFDKRPQPLLGIYSREIVPTMEKSIQEGVRRLREFLKKIDVLYIPEDEVRAIDPEGRSFVNINTPEDFAKEIGR
jgi:molybdopterin-guanine dinucleotide biosynthesis protein A